MQTATHSVQTDTTYDLPLSAYNECVLKTYRLIHTWATAAISSIEEDAIRWTLIRQDPLPITQGKIVHELISPILYLRLECYSNEELGISYGYEPNPSYGQYYSIMASFIRMLYKVTMAKPGQLNIESALRIYHIQTDCADLFDYLIGIGSRYHKMELLPYKAKPVKRKLRRVA